MASSFAAISFPPPSRMVSTESSRQRDLAGGGAAEIVSRELQVQRRTGPPAWRQDAGHVWHRSDGQAVGVIGTALIAQVAQEQEVGPRPGRRKDQGHVLRAEVGAE